MGFRRIKKGGRRLFLLLVICPTLLLVYLWSARDDLSHAPAMQTVYCVQTDRTACAVTLSLTGVESRVSLELLASVCEGMELRPCIFVTTEWLHENPELIPSLSFAELGLLFEDDPAKWTKKRTMASIAEENERFLSMTGAFPRLVRLANDSPKGYVSDALQSFGQVCVGSKATLTDALSAGNIVDLGLLNGTTGYALAKFCAGALAGGFEVISLSDLLASTKA